MELVCSMFSWAQGSLLALKRELIMVSAFSSGRSRILPPVPRVSHGTPASQVSLAIFRKEVILHQKVQQESKLQARRKGQ